MWCVLVVLGLAACIEPRLVPCGDQLCPVGTTCVGGELCANADQIDACVGLADGATCTVGGGVGRCDRGVCVAAGCGNGAVDPDEACDDGNTTSGDGCRADCRKVERCGDAVVDDGEGCDDGNPNAADGCDACVPTTWRATALIGGSLDATTVSLDAPQGVAVDRGGNIYLTDMGNNRVRRVDTSGVITTVAQLTVPFGVAVDGLANVYVAEPFDNRIRRVDAAGVITTVAGTGQYGYGGDGALATGARLAWPFGVAVDGLGNVYIADTSNHRVRRVDTMGGITTVAGTGSRGYSGDGQAALGAQLASPFGVAVDVLGNVYIADSGNQRIRRVDPAGIITTIAGDGTTGYSGDGQAAPSAQLALASDFMAGNSIAVDGVGNLYIADTENHRVRRVDPTGIITTVAGDGTPGFGGDGQPATSAQLGGPSALAIDGLGNLYIADTSNDRIRRVDQAGIITTVAGSGTADIGDGGAATSASLDNASGVAVDGLGAVYIADRLRHRIRRVDATGLITTVAGTGTSGPGGDGGAATSAELAHPYDVAFDGAGNLYIADTFNRRIRRVDPAGIITTVAGTGTAGYSGDGGAATDAQLASPRDITFDAAGNLYITDTGSHCIRRVDATGLITTVAGTGSAGFSGDGGPALGAQLASPEGVAIDAAGNLYIADTSNNRIRRVDPAGVITTVAGIGLTGFSGDGGAATSARLFYPSAVAIAGAGGIYINDASNNRIRRVDAAGIITTVAGGPTGSFGGDGGAASSAQIDPTNLVADGLGNLYVVEPWHVRRIDASGVITTIAGQIDPEGMGPLARARLVDPVALDVAAPFTLIAGGRSGTVQAARSGAAWLEVVAGRYPQPSAAGARARFRDYSFGTVSGIAYDAAASAIYVVESSSNRLHVITVVDPADESTWTIAPLANASGAAGFADGAAAAARFRNPTGLYLDGAARQLYVADTGNHVVRAIDLSDGVADATVRTVAGRAAIRGYYGDGSAASEALLYAPQAVTRCASGDLFVADTGNHRVRRVAASTNEISTVLGDGVPASSGEGAPAWSFPVDTPLGLACDSKGNLFVTSTTAVRLVPADARGVVDGTGGVQTIYGGPPRDAFPASVTACLTGLAIVDATTVQVVDACTGLLVELRREPAP